MIRRTFAFTIALACVPASAGATTFVVFRVPDRIVMASDVFAVGLDATGRTRDTAAPCKIKTAGKFWFLNGGYFVPDLIADRIKGQPTVPQALKALEAADLQSRVVAAKQLYSERQSPGSPLLTVVVADGAMNLGVYAITLKTGSPFTVQAESATCPGALCPLGSYFLVGQAQGAEPAPMPSWFPGQGDAGTARRFIEAEINRVGHLARAPIDTLELTRDDARWFERDARSACTSIP